MGDVPATSPLAGLRDRIEQARARATTDLPVSDLPGVFVRYRALDYDTVEDVTRKHAKQGASPKAGDRSILARACVGIFVEDDGRIVSIDPDGDAFIDSSGTLHGTPVTFSSDRLAQLLDLEVPARPAETVPALFPRELEIGRHAQHVARFSSGEAEAVNRAALGN